MAWQHISPDMTVKGFKKCCISSVVDGTDDMLWNGSEEDGDVRSECGRWRNWLVETEYDVLFCIKCMKALVKYLFLADIFFLSVILDLDKYIFPWQSSFLGVILD